MNTQKGQSVWNRRTILPMVAFAVGLSFPLIARATGSCEQCGAGCESAWFNARAYCETIPTQPEKTQCYEENYAIYNSCMIACWEPCW